MKRLKLFLILILVMLVPAGCTTDGIEIDDQVYALVIGCDRGVDNKIRVTVQFPTYKEGGGGGGSTTGAKKKGGEGGEDKSLVSGTVVTTIEASSILEGMNLLNSAVTRRISLKHTKAIIFSEALARQGVRDFVESISRFREARRIMQVIVCKGSVQDFIMENKTNVGESLAKAMELAAMQSEYTGLFPRVPFQKFYAAMISPYSNPVAAYAGLNNLENLSPFPEGNFKSPFTPQIDAYPGDLPRAGDRKVEYLGTAVFNGDKMVGTLSSNETRFFQMITGQFQRGMIVIEDRNAPGKAIPLDLRLARNPVVNAKFENGIPVISVKLNVEADLGAIQSRIPYESLEKMKDLNDQIRTMVQEGAEKTIRKVREDYNSDVFDFGKKIARHFFTITEFEKYNWLSHFKDAKINVDVKASVRRTGLMYHSAPIRGHEGEQPSGGKTK